MCCAAPIALKTCLRESSDRVRNPRYPIFLLTPSELGDTAARSWGHRKFRDRFEKIHTLRDHRENSHTRGSGSEDSMDFGGEIYILMDFGGKVCNLFVFFCLPTSFGRFSIAIWSYALRFKQDTNEIRDFRFPEKVLVEKKLVGKILVEKKMIEKKSIEKNFGRKKNIGRNFFDHRFFSIEKKSRPIFFSTNIFFRPQFFSIDFFFDHIFFRPIFFDHFFSETQNFESHLFPV